MLNQLGIAAVEEGKANRALALYRQSLKIKKKVHDGLGMAKILGQMGKVYQEQADLVRATRYNCQRPRGEVGMPFEHFWRVWTLMREQAD